jgi:hypothetical protein
MRCEEFKRLYLESETTRTTPLEGDMNKHLDQCEDCREMVRQVRQGWDLLDDLPVLEPVADFNQAVWRKIGEKSRRAWWQRPLLPSAPTSLRLAAVAVVVLAVLGIGYVSFFTGPAEPVVFTAKDLKDNELLLEMEQVLDFDETQVLSIYEPWEVSADTLDKEEGDGSGTPGENGNDEKRQITYNRAFREKQA